VAILEKKNYSIKKVIDGEAQRAKECRM